MRVSRPTVRVPGAIPSTGPDGGPQGSASDFRLVGVGAPQLGATGAAELAQGISGSVVDDFRGLTKALVRRKIGFDDHAHDSVGTFDNAGGRQYAHPADQGIELHEIRNLRLVVLVGVRVPLRSLVDEVLVELDAPVPAPDALLGAR